MFESVNVNRVLLSFIVLVISFSSLNSQDLPLQSEQIGIYEHLGDYVPEGIYFTKQDSSIVELKSLIDKPTVFSFVYYDCPGLCSPLLNGLAEVIDRSESGLGEDYQMVTVSMNEDDTPKLGISKKHNYVSAIDKRIDESQWIWLTGDKENIYKLSNALGFKFKRDGDDFIHTAALIVVSPKGKITRYLHGTYFLPFDLKMAVIEAADEKSRPTINKLLKYCFSYDATGKTYVMNFTKISATIILLLILLFVSTVLLKRKPELTK